MEIEIKKVKETSGLVAYRVIYKGRKFHANESSKVRTIMEVDKAEDEKKIYDEIWKAIDEKYI